MKNIVKALPEAMIAGFAMCLLAFISFNCVDTPLAPIAPSSDIQLSMPVADVTHYVLEWVQKSSALALNPGGTFSYLYNQSMPPQGINQIALQPQFSSQQVGVGQFSIDPFSLSSTYKASDLGFPQSGSAPVPSGSISLPPVGINQSSNLIMYE